MMLAVSKVYGAMLLGASAVVFLLVPLVFLLVANKKINRLPLINDSSTNPRFSEPIGFASIVQSTVVLAALNSKVILLFTALLTLVSVYFAFKLEPTFDVKDFFDSDSDFVIGLDKLSEHLADKGGEPGVAYIRGDLMDPESVRAISEFIEKLRDVEAVAESPSGEITIGLDVVNTTRLIMESSAMLKAVTNQTGFMIEDFDEDGIPDTRSQMVAVYEFALDHGVLSDDGNILLRPDQVAGAIYYPEDSEKNMEYLTTISFQIPGTRNQSAVTVAGDSVKPLLLDLQAQPTIEKTGLTGSPFTREEQLTASTRTLYTSLPIAFVAATLLLIFAMRSIRFAIVTVIPILLVVTWLYGIMYLAGFALNFVTAMIGAISIGVGIDYSIHMTQRFREELRKNTTKISAIASAARGTGVALVASAASSVVGFAIMGFAPMPMFASYGRLTAMMIFFALMSSLLVLPCLLMLVTKQSDLEVKNNTSVADA
jgi:predicted RND superfamily exporter protein